MKTRIIDILRVCSYERIESKLIHHYGEKGLEEYQKLYHELNSMKINPLSYDDLCIYITAYEENEDDSFSINDFNEDDTKLYYDVSAYNIANNDITYSIATSCYSDFLQYSVDAKTLERFSFETILAHCFWEITSYCFDDN